MEEARAAGFPATASAARAQEFLYGELFVAGLDFGLMSERCEKCGTFFYTFEVRGSETLAVLLFLTTHRRTWSHIVAHRRTLLHIVRHTTDTSAATTSMVDYYFAGAKMHTQLELMNVEYLG